MNAFRPRLMIVLLAFFAVEASNARIVRTWTYQEMFDKADLVVVAELIGTKDTGERSVLTDLRPHVSVVGVSTEFRTRLVLKGARNLGNFHLHHYRLTDEKDKRMANGPDLVRLSGQHSSFLMFLVKEAGGRYAPVSGQTDPATFSVLELHGGAQ